MKYQFIREFSASYPVRIMCDVLEVSPSGYYAWRDRPCSARQRQDAQLLEQLCALHAASREVYGSPRLLQALRQTGVACSRKRVIRLMRQAGLRSKRHRCRRRRCTTRRNPAHRVAPNLLQQRFVATAPHQVWLVDMSYIPTQAGWLYLAVVLDLSHAPHCGLGDGCANDRCVEPTRLAHGGAPHRPCGTSAPLGPR